MHRLVDANANRAAEGLRVLEDLCRFELAAPGRGAEAKELRHLVRGAVPPEAVGRRDTPGDAGTAVTAADEGVRRDVVALVRANAARVGESLRALEEAAKLTGGPAELLEGLRYRLYTLESTILADLPAWRLREIRLYVLIDTACCDDPPGVAAAAARGGAGVVQLRAKDLDVPAYRDLACRVRDAVGDAAMFAVNDHVALAPALDAPVVHVGQRDPAVADARLAVGAGRAIGVSTHSREELLTAQAGGADYVGVGPMFATDTKAHEPARGPALLAALADDLVVPSYALGGLDEDRVRDLRPRLPHGVAVAGAVCRAGDPEGVCRRLCELLAG